MTTLAYVMMGLLIGAGVALTAAMLLVASRIRSAQDSARMVTTELIAMRSTLADGLTGVVTVARTFAPMQKLFRDADHG